jgi:hypothetical protein
MGSLNLGEGAAFDEDALKHIDIPLPPHLVGYEIKRGQCMAMAGLTLSHVPVASYAFNMPCYDSAVSSGITGVCTWVL